MATTFTEEATGSLHLGWQRARLPVKLEGDVVKLMMQNQLILAGGWIKKYESSSALLVAGD
jgi:hypothetical protein